MRDCMRGWDKGEVTMYCEMWAGEVARRVGAAAVGALARLGAEALRPALATSTSTITEVRSIRMAAMVQEKPGMSTYFGALSKEMNWLF